MDLLYLTADVLSNYVVNALNIVGGCGNEEVQFCILYISYRAFKTLTLFTSMTIHATFHCT